MPAPFHRQFVCCLAAWLLGIVAVALAEKLPPEERVLRLVDRQAGLCVGVANLGERLPEIEQSGLVQRLAASDVFRRWQSSADYGKLLNVRDDLLALLKTPSIDQFVRDLFGQSLVLAVYPAERGEPAGVLLTYAAGQDVLVQALAAWNEAESAKTDELRHEGLVYFRRQSGDSESAARRVQYYARLGNIFVLSDRESAVQRAIELSVAETVASAAESLAGDDRFLKSRGALGDRALVWGWINPRAWDATLAAQRESADAGERAVWNVWNHCQSVAVALYVEQGVVVEAIAHYDTPQAKSWTDFVGNSRGPAGFLGRVPSQALLVTAGRHNLRETEVLLSSQLPDDARRHWRLIKQFSPLLALDFVGDVLPALGDDWVLYFVPRADMALHAPVDGVLAFELESNDAPDAAAARAARARLESGLSTAFERVGRLASRPDRPDVRVQSQSVAETEVRWIDGLQPFAPAFAVSNEYVVVASSPAAVVALLELPAEGSLASEAKFRDWRDAWFGRSGQVLYLNLDAARAWLRQLHTALATLPDEDADGPLHSAVRQFDRMDDVLRLADAAFVAVEIDQQRVRLVVGAVVEEPALRADSP